MPVCRGLLFGALLLTLASCRTGAAGPPLPASPPSQLCRDPKMGERSFCMPARRINELLVRAPFRLLNLRGTYGGTTGAQQMRISFADQGGRRLILMAKWKRAPSGLDGANNNPRRELAAYVLQTLLWRAEDDWVVPPTVMRCVPTDALRRFDTDASPNVDGLSCVFGVMSYWLRGATHDGVWNERRFASDTRYRHHMADLNLFTYLIEHRDSRTANFMIAKDPAHPRVFAIDNGLAFGSFLKNPMAFFSTDWSKIFVPQLSRASVERLRQLTPQMLRAALRVVAEFVVEGGVARAVPPTAPRGRGGVTIDKQRVQLGLTDAEIDKLAARVRDVLAKVDGKQIKVF
ncbi:MAG: hypothetical protein KC503_43025 [Myxococcales bacterium]|nr:hypothetical protein [Myxococcales bacterium]